MSNSPLVNYTRISPNSSARTAKINSIIIHHMASTALTIEACGAEFARAERKASSNYGVGTDGRIGLYVDESRRAWTSSNWQADNSAITIEVQNCTKGPNWEVSDKALQATIDLCVDICKRNGIKKLNYTGDKSGNLLMHKWFAATGCPGPYLGSKFPYIADEVNKRLGSYESNVTETPKENTVASTTTLSIGDKVTLASGAKYTSGKDVPDWVCKKTLYVRGISGDNITISIYNTGSITGVVSKKYIVKNGETVSTAVTSKPSNATLSIGDEVKLTAGATYTSGKSIPDWVFKKTLYVRGVSGDNITISTLASGAITGVVNKKYLTVLKATSTNVSTDAFSVGDEVKLLSGATYTSGKSCPSWLFSKKLYVRELQGSNIVISTLKTGAITGTVNKKYLTKY